MAIRKCSLNGLSSYSGSVRLKDEIMVKFIMLFVGVLVLIVACEESAETQPEPIPQFDISKSDDGFYAGSGFVVIDYSENANTIEWDFGDGTVSPDSIVEHSYDRKGTYELTLKACNSAGCEDFTLQIAVKDSIINLLAGKVSKTWNLTRWVDRQGNAVPFDTCSTCHYSQTFYNNGDPPYYDGEHRWLKRGLQICGEDSIRCSVYNGPEDHGWFYFVLDPYNRNNSIAIGLASKIGYTIIVDENQLYLKVGLTREEFYYERR